MRVNIAYVNRDAPARERVENLSRLIAYDLKRHTNTSV